MLCTVAVLERGHSSTDEKGRRELCQFLGDVGPGRAKIRCKGLSWGCTCYVHGTRRKAAYLEYSDGAKMAAQESLITEALVGLNSLNSGCYSAQIGESLENYTQGSVMEGLEVSKTLLAALGA